MALLPGNSDYHTDQERAPARGEEDRRRPSRRRRRSWGKGPKKTMVSNLRGCPVWGGSAEEEMRPLMLLAGWLKISWHHQASADMALPLTLY